MSRFFAVVVNLVALSSFCLGCASQRPWVAKAAEGDGVRIEMSSYEYDSDDINLLLRVMNQTNDSLVIDLDTIRVVLPDGTEVKQDDGMPYFTLMGGLSRYLRVKFDSGHFDLNQAPGVWMRFDGVYVGEKRLKVPPMQIAAPKHAAGNAEEHPIPAIAYEEFAKGRERTGLPLVVATGTTAAATAAVAPTPAPPPPDPNATQVFTGVRQRIKAENTKVAAMPMKVANVSDTAAFIVDDLLLTELQTVGFQAIGPEDINALVGFEQIKDQLECDEASCAAEIGSALGVPFLTAGNLANVDGMTVLTIKLINVRDTTVVARVSKMATGGARIMPRVIAEAVQEMVRRSGL